MDGSGLGTGPQAGRLRRWLLAAEDRAERWISDRRKRRGRSRPATVEAHAGYAHPGGARLLGRVLEEGSAWAPGEGDGRLASLRGVGSLFATHEVPHARVALRYGSAAETATADAEGYVDVVLPPARPGPTGWDEATAHVLDAEGTPTSEPVPMPVLRVGPEARFAVLSDIDDTIMRTGAENLARNLWTTFTANPLRRHVYADVAELVTRLAYDDGVRANPVFYLSSSPWNLYGLIRDVLERNGVPWGPIFLRDYGIDETKFIKSTHGAHKVGNAKRVMDDLDGLPFLLMGDLGQADAEIYAEVARARPGRVMGVILHQPSRRAHEAKRRHVEEIEGMGIPALVTRDYAEAIAFAERHDWLGAPA